MAYVDQVLADTPVAYWRLGESSGTTAVDETGNGHDGTFVNTPTLGATGLVDDADNAVNFAVGGAGGGGEHMTVPDDAALQLTECTVECWFYLEAGTTSLPYFVTEVFGGPHVNYQLSGSHNGAGASMKPAFGFHDGITHGWETVEGPDALEDETTYYLVGTFDGTDLKLYVDAVEVASATANGPMLSDNDGLYINRRWDGGSTPGIIDEVAIYDYALTPERITAHYLVGTGQSLPITSGLTWG